MPHKIKAARVPWPGKILAMELEARGWNQKQLAEVIGRDVQLISGIINGKRAITPETAIQLSQALDIDAEIWMNLEYNFRLFQARKAINKGVSNDIISRRAKLQKFGSYSELSKRGWVAPAKDIKDKENNLKDFFGKNSLDKINLSFPDSCYHSEYWENRSGLIAIWLRRVAIIAEEGLNLVNKYSREKINNYLPDLLALSLDLNDIFHAPEVLAKMGIIFTIVPSLPETNLDAAFFYYKGHPVIGITLRIDRLDYFWFALLHELGHIYLNHNSQRLDCLFDNDIENQKDEQEIAADEFARERLIPQKKLVSFRSSLKGRKPTKAEVIQFSITQRRNPAIVVGRLQHDNFLPSNMMRDLLIKIRTTASPMIDRYYITAGKNFSEHVM